MTRSVDRLPCKYVCLYVRPFVDEMNEINWTIGANGVHTIVVVIVSYQMTG